MFLDEYGHSWKNFFWNRLYNKKKQKEYLQNKKQTLKI